MSRSNPKKKSQSVLPSPQVPRRAWRGWTHVFTRRRFRIGAIILIVVLASLVRFIHIGADPPADVSWSQDLLTDPPQYSSFARDAIVLGEWNPLHNDRLVLFQKNITGGFCYIAYSIFGPGIAPANFTAALLNLCAIMFLAWGVARAFGWWAGIGTGWLLAVNYLFVAYGRQPFLEVASNACLAFAFWGIIRSSKTWWIAIISGLIAGVGALFGKMTALHAAPIFAVAVMLVGWQCRHDPAWRRWGRPLGYGFGFLSVALVSYLFVYRLASADVLAYLQEQSNSLYGSPVGLASFTGFLQQWFSFGVDTGLLTRGPVLSALGLLGMCGMVIHYGRGTSFRDMLERLPVAVVLIVGWFLSAYLALSPFNYRPVRYQIVLLFPLAAAAGWLIHRLVASIKHDETPQTQSMQWWTIPVVTIILATGFQHLVILNLMTARGAQFTGAAISASLGLAALTALVWWWFEKRQLGSSLRLLTFRPLTEVIVALILLGSLVNQGRYFFHWWDQSAYTLQAANRDLARVLGPNAVVTGTWATSLTQNEESPRRVTHMFSLEEPPEFFDRYPITHVVVENKPDGPFFQEYPDLARNARRVATYSIQNLRVAVLRIAESMDNPDAQAYQLSPFEQMQERNRGLPLDTICVRSSAFVADSFDTYSGWLYVGEKWHQADSTEAALQAYQRALLHSPDDFVLLAMTGDLSWQRYRTWQQDGSNDPPPERDEALRLWRRALELSSGNPQLQQRIRRAERL